MGKDNESIWTSETQRYSKSLAGQIYEFMCDYQPHTNLAICIGIDRDIAELSSVTAAVRSLRKKPFFKTIVRSRNEVDPENGKFRYSLLMDATVYWGEDDEPQPQMSAVEKLTTSDKVPYPHMTVLDFDRLYEKLKKKRLVERENKL